MSNRLMIERTRVVMRQYAVYSSIDGFMDHQLLSELVTGGQKYNSLPNSQINYIKTANKARQ